MIYSGSSATLSPWRSGKSCLSKEQRETPLMSSTKVNQTGVEKKKSEAWENPVGPESDQEKESSN